MLKDNATVIASSNVLGIVGMAVRKDRYDAFVSLTASVLPQRWLKVKYGPVGIVRAVRMSLTV
jgi:hypothetical protein